jgi:K319-like protein
LKIITRGHYKMRARIIILPVVAVILLSVTALLQNLPMIYADNPVNQPPINDMSDQVATSSTSPPPSAAQQQQQLQQLTQQTQQPPQQLPPPQQQQTLIPPYNTISNNSTANMGIPNSNPRSSIKVTSVDQQVPPFPPVPISTSPPPSAAQQQQQLQQQIQDILTQSSYVPSNANSLSTSNSNSQSSIKIASVVPPFPPVPISTSPPLSAAQQQQQLQQLTQQTQQPPQQLPPPQQQQTLIPPYNTISNNSTANMGIPNSNPRSSIKVTSVDQQVPPFPPVPISTSSSTNSPSQNDGSQATNYSGNDHQSIPNLVVNGGSPVTLDGSLSYDPDGNQITFAWTQTAGPSVIISDANTSKAKFTAPNLDNDKIMLFKLMVTDENGLSDSGIVRVTVIPSASPSLRSSMN